MDEKLPKFLQEMKDENPFQVPPEYFKNLSTQTWKRMQKTQESRGIRWVPDGFRFAIRATVGLLRPTMAFGAIALLIGLAILWPNTEEFGGHGAMLTEQEILTYIAENVDDFDVNELYWAEALTMEEVPSDLLGDPSDELELEPVFEELIEDLDLEDIL
ncbi:MAG: hypothetical protein HKN87_23980 [Saprospiraceae bacterium]|nr:hypothetical protein [Saprospiraceae bacterium]